MGLIGNHSYGVQEIAIIPATNEKLVKLRNPWGNFEWTGDWSDQSANWTPELKKTLNYTDSEDGTFWMSFVDFCHYFS